MREKMAEHNVHMLVPEVLWLKVKTRAKRMQKTMTAVVIEALRDWLNKKG